MEIPNYIKMDVDGIEDLILQGGSSVFKNKKVESVLIENAGNYNKINNFMRDSGFKINSIHKNNQIWKRKLSK